MVELLIQDFIITASGSFVAQLCPDRIFYFIHGAKKGFQGLFYPSQRPAVIRHVCQIVPPDACDNFVAIVEIRSSDNDMFTTSQDDISFLGQFILDHF